MAEKKEKKAKNIHEIKVEITGKDWEKKLDETFKKIIKACCRRNKCCRQPLPHCGGCCHPCLSSRGSVICPRPRPCGPW